MATLKTCVRLAQDIEAILSTFSRETEEDAFWVECQLMELDRIALWLIDGRYTLIAAAKALRVLRKDIDPDIFIEVSDVGMPDTRKGWTPILPGEEG